jgi:hypothetical protein
MQPASPSLFRKVFSTKSDGFRLWSQGRPTEKKILPEFVTQRVWYLWDSVCSKKSHTQRYLSYLPKFKYMYNYVSIQVYSYIMIYYYKSILHIFTCAYIAGSRFRRFESTNSRDHRANFSFHQKTSLDNYMFDIILTYIYNYIYIHNHIYIYIFIIYIYSCIYIYHWHSGPILKIQSRPPKLFSL